MHNINKKKLPILISLSLIAIAIIIYIFLKISNSIEIVSANKFYDILNKNNLSFLYIKDNYIYAKTKNKEYKTLVNGINLQNLYKKYPIKIYPKSKNYLTYIAILLLFSILISILVILKRTTDGNNSILVQKDKNDILENRIEPTICSNISFEDVLGISDIKDDLVDIVNFLQNRASFIRKGIKIPKGVLLIGPPGVGKTLIAKAISSEANVPFFYHSGANFVQIYAGMGAKRVKELFNRAKEMAPSIIFIDEIDAVGKSRDKLNSDEREATLNQLLIEMDGFENSLGVVVIAATNRVDILDSALLRPGRFDRRIYIDLPNIKDREEIIQHYLKGKKYNFDIKEIAKITAGFSPASLEVLVNEALIYAYKNRKKEITLEDIYKIKDRVMYGKKRIKLLNEEEKEIQASYQIAKAVVAIWFGFEFDKLSLLNPLELKDEKLLKSKSYYEKLLIVYRAGDLYLYKKYKDFFEIEDKNIVLNLINKIRKLDIKNSYNLEDIDNKTVELLKSFEPIIKNLVIKLKTKEILDYKEIKKVINELF